MVICSCLIRQLPSTLHWASTTSEKSTSALGPLVKSAELQDAFNSPKVHSAHIATSTELLLEAYVNCEACTTSCKRKQSTALTPIPGHWRGQSRLLLPRALVLKFRFSKFLVCIQNFVTSCFLLYENEGSTYTPHLLPKRCQFVMKEHITRCVANSVICDLASMFAGSALTRICRHHIPKHLKGQLGPCVSDVMFH